MTEPNHKEDPTDSTDPVKNALKYAHIVLPIVGGVLIFLMASIAVIIAT